MDRSRRARIPFAEVKNKEFSQNKRQGFFQIQNGRHYSKGNFAHFKSPSHLIDFSSKRDAWGKTLPRSNLVDKGKAPMRQDDSAIFWACFQCASSGLANTLCKQWSSCVKCQRKGHTTHHCKAQWRKTGKISVLEPNNLPGASFAGNIASSSKNINRATEGNLSPHFALNSSHSSPRSSKNLACQSVNPPPLSPKTSSPHGVPQVSASMAYQRVDPTPFAPHGFHAMEIQ
jgi:hypothetical protein